jgi:NAD(P)-dependent dehydrogenase (short-subunit alcohol dehydrogenase family)
MNFFDSIWKKAKIWNRVPLGPVSVIFRMAKTTKISNNFIRQFKAKVKGGVVFAAQEVKDLPNADKLPRGSGTIVLVGSTSGLSGRENHLNLAVGKFGLRALSQVMARELWDKGIHVVHCVIDADIKENDLQPPSNPQANPEDLADFIFQLHNQPRTTWTSEADIRPFNEKFWEHC